MLRPPRLLRSRTPGQTGSCRETHDPIRPPPVLGDSSRPFSSQPPPLCSTDADFSQTLLWGIIRVLITVGAWLRAQASMKKRRFRWWRPGSPLLLGFEQLHILRF